MAMQNSSSNGPGRDWRSRTSPAMPGTPAAKSGKQKKIIALLAVLLGLLGAFAGLLYYWQTVPEPFCIAIPIREYKARQLPPNAFAVQDVELLLEHFLPEKQKNAYQSQSLSPLRAQLRAVEEHKDSPLLFYLTAHGMSREGKIYVLPADVNPDLADDRWLLLDEVLDSMKRCPTREKILLLDLMQPLVGARLGIVKNNLAEEVNTYLKSREKDLNFWVFCACGADQVSLVSEDLGHSLFIYYLHRGLQGLADQPSSGGNGDNRVTVKELCHFVTGQTDLWASRNWDSRQVPALIGRGVDFPVVSLTSSGQVPPFEMAEQAEYPKWLAEGWKLRDQWWKDGTFTLIPRHFRQMEGVLLRTELRWRFGFEAKRLEEDLKTSLDNFKKDYQSALELPRRGPRSLALAKNWQKPPEVKKDEKKEGKEEKKINVGEEVRSLLRMLGGTPPAKAEDLKKAGDEFVKKCKDAPVQEVQYLLCYALTDLAEPRKEQIVVVADILANLTAERQMYTETITVQRVKELIDKIAFYEWGEFWPSPAVPFYFQANKEAEQVIVMLSEAPILLPWVEKSLKKADERRREGERLLFGGRPPDGDWAKAYESLSAARSGYNAISKQLVELQTAHQVLSESLATLPGHLEYLTELTKISPGEESTLVDACRFTKNLHELLSQPDPNRLGEIESARLRVKSQLFQLTRNLKNRIANVRKAGDSGAFDQAECHVLLGCSLLSAEERLPLWSLLHARQGTIHEKMEQEQKSPPEVSTPSLEELSNREQDRARRRTRLTLELLKMAKVPSLNKLEGAVEMTLKTSNKESWETLGQMFRQALGDEMPRQYRGSRKDLFAAQRLAYLMAPFDVDREVVPTQELWMRNPAWQWRKESIITLYHALGDRFREDSRLFPDQSPYARFYRDAAEEYLR